MIKLKTEVNKCEVMRKIKRIAHIRNRKAFHGGLREKAFINGAEALFNLLRLPRVINLACKNEQLL